MARIFKTLFFLASVSERNGTILGAKHLVKAEDRRAKLTLCGIEQKGKGRKVEWTWWQIMEVPLDPLLAACRKRGEGEVCVACQKDARNLDRELERGRQERLSRGEENKHPEMEEPGEE